MEKACCGGLLMVRGAQRTRGGESVCVEDYECFAEEQMSVLTAVVNRGYVRLFCTGLMYF